MIEITTTPAGRRVVMTCDACSQPITSAAGALVVPWASRTALVCHAGECIAALRLQYPSTAGDKPIEMAEALAQLVEALGLTEPAA